MANRNTTRHYSGYAPTQNVIRKHSHILLEALLLASAFIILCILFGFFVLELKQLTSSPASTTQKTQEAFNPISQPPLLDMRGNAHALLIVEVDASNTVLQTIFTSSLNDALADFTLFAVPQTGYNDIVYVRPILEGSVEQVSIYPLVVSTGTIKASTLTIPSNAFITTQDQTAVGALVNNQLVLFWLENGNRAAEITLSPEWQAYVQTTAPKPILSSPECITLSTTSLAPSNPPVLCLPN